MAYVNFISVDRNFVLQTDISQTNFVRITEAAKESGAIGGNGLHERLYAEVTVKQAGYMYIYLSNDNPTVAEVYFDDFKVTQVKSPVIQQDDYYPFGLAFNSYSRENSTPNDYKFNGKEEQTELGLGWLDYGARMYDPALGRFFVQDALADFKPDWTPYRYAFNNPINIIDPSGNYEINVTLSKDEEKQLKGIEDKKERRAARAELIEGKKQVVRDFVSQAKGPLDSNSDLKSAFVAFSGVKEGSDSWNNLWTENGKGPTLTSDGNLGKSDASGWTADGGQIGFNPFNELGQNVLTTLHEYVHYGDDLRTQSGQQGYENTPNGAPGYDAQKQREALNEAYQRASNDPDPARRVTQSQWNGYYQSYYQNGKVSSVELGYGYERSAFGRVYITSQDYKEFTAKYLNKK